ncbi:amidohydrolase family protein [Amycolatopsis echigonensis]|uniref:Amidohydrolase family protein n=1 Tax=Amycolatopsis echigonensis TaxID=2576905 RepID=A0A8E1W6S5_9PSEU|nr:amidohydrolase family protein [Amycolatopsis echigonensis]MBB2505151.1 amidohydrolase family protein [Amycolatopsis echigonensis]
MSVEAKPAVHSPAASGVSGAVVDVDIHENMPNLRVLLPYLEPQWQRHITDYGWTHVRSDYPYWPPTAGTGGLRMDAVPEVGGPPGSDLDLMRGQLLDRHDIGMGVLTGQHHFSAMRGWYEFAAAIASAYNDWQIEYWLDRDPRLRGSVQVACQEPEAAAREIDRIGSHPQMVQVFLPMITHMPPIGDPFYRPMMDAIERNGLQLALHVGQATKTPFGYHRYYVEWHTALPQAGMSEVISLVFNGTFERYPELKVMVLECGFSWLPHAMSRFDQQYRELRAEVPWVKRLPSEHLRERVRVSTQPMEQMTLHQLNKYLELMETDEMICFSSDYPHFDFDAPERILPAGLPESTKRKILRENSLAFYGLTS